MTLPAKRPGQPGAPRIDIPGRRLTLPRHLVPIALMLRRRAASAPGGDSMPGRAELENAGIAGERGLHPLAHRILTPMASPDMVVSVEVAEKGGRRFATIWGRGSAATLGTAHDGDSFVLDEIEVGLLPFHLAAVTRLEVRPPPESEPMIVAGAEVADIPAGGAEPLQDGTEGSGGDLVLRLRAASRSRWTVSSLWGDAEGSVMNSSLEVIDAGPLGYWEVTHLAAGRVALTARGLESVLRLLADATPDV